MPTEYAHALAQSLEHTDNKGAIVDGLIRVLRHEGKMKALPAILKEYGRIKEHKEYYALLTIARESDEEQSEVALKDRFGITSLSTVDIQDNLIGGWRYEDANTLIDTSHKAALLKLYRNITK